MKAPAVNVERYMTDHGLMQTNIYSVSADRGRTFDCPYPLQGGETHLVLEMESRQPPWKDPVLKGAHIQSQGTNIISITLTNAP